MAKKSVLTEAVRMLSYNNGLILRQIASCSSNKKREELEKQLSKNNSMILDYKYRIENGEDY